MKKYLLCLLLIVFFSCPALSGIPEYVDGQVLVTVKTSENLSISALAEDLASKFQLEVLNIMIVGGKGVILLRSENKSTAELIQELPSVSYVESVEPNGINIINPPVEPPVKAGSGGCNANYTGISMLFSILLLAVVRGK